MFIKIILRIISSFVMYGLSHRYYRLRNRDMKRAFPAWLSVLLTRLIRTAVCTYCRKETSKNWWTITRVAVPASEVSFIMQKCRLRAMLQWLDIDES